MIRSWLLGFWGLFYPNLCAVCDTPLVHGEEVMCTGCNYKLPRTRSWGESDNEVAKIFWGRVYLLHACSFFYFRKGSRYQKLLHKLKYSGRTDIGRYLGQQFGQELRNVDHFKDIAGIIPVPLHPKKLRKRGYNQSEWIALGLSDTMSVPVVTNVLLKTTHTESQTKKSRLERWDNVSEVFSITNKELIKGKHLLLVDDVVTTGATLEACAQVLINEGECTVSVVTLACVGR